MLVITKLIIQNLIREFTTTLYECGAAVLLVAADTVWRFLVCGALTPVNIKRHNSYAILRDIQTGLI